MNRIPSGNPSQICFNEVINNNENILYNVFVRVKNPSLVSQVCKLWNEIHKSNHIYSAFLDTYKSEELMIRLTPFYPSPVGIENINAVKWIFRFVWKYVQAETNRYMVDIHEFNEFNDLSPLDLNPIMKWLVDSSYALFFEILAEKIPKVSDWLKKLCKLCPSLSEKAKSRKEWIERNPNEFNLLNELTINENLWFIPSEIGRLSNLQKLTFEDMYVPIIPQEIYMLTNLEELVLDQLLGDLYPLSEKISCLTKLKNLNICFLKGGLLGEVPEEITQLTNLEKLNFVRSEITKLPNLQNLTNLTHLDLSSNKLTALFGIKTLTKLTYLALYRNKLINISDGISALVNLNKLYLDENQLTELPVGITRLLNLMELNLSHNQLNKLPDGMSRLNALQSIKIDNNLLTQLPQDFGFIHGLQHLSLKSNLLKEMPEQILECANLRYLDLCENNLTVLTSKISKLVNLRYLSLNKNYLKKLPEEIGMLTKLDNLNIGDNPFENLPKSIKMLQFIVIDIRPSPMWDLYMGLLDEEPLFAQIEEVDDNDWEQYLNL